MNTALLSVALGDWTQAEEALTEVVTNEPENYAVGPTSSRPILRVVSDDHCDFAGCEQFSSGLVESGEN
jgi:hypothetical protein